MSITDDDQIWEDAIEGATPLKKDARANKAYTPKARRPIEGPQPPACPVTPPPPKDLLLDKSLGDIFAAHAPGLDAKKFKKFSCGGVEFTAKVDLHGLVVEDAYQACFGFLLAAQAGGHRCVLVVHGKGGGRAGPIKQNISTWLHQHPSVLAFHTAQPRHGGGGAVYVLLRKK